MEWSVVVIWFLWGQNWIVAFRCGTFLFVLIIIFKYCDWHRNDVGPTLAGDINPTSKWRWGGWADIARPISTQRRPNTCSLVVFFSLHNLPELLCAEIVPMLEAAINSGPVVAWLQTYCTLTWKLHIETLRPRRNRRHFSRPHFQMHSLECKYMNSD